MSTKIRNGTFTVIVAADARPELEDIVTISAGLVFKYTARGQLRCIQIAMGIRRAI